MEVITGFPARAGGKRKALRQAVKEKTGRGWQVRTVNYTLSKRPTKINTFRFAG